MLLLREKNINVCVFVYVCVCLDTEAVFSLLKKCHPHMTAYRKEAIPDKLHYRNNKHIQPIILVADEGWTIVQQGELPRCKARAHTHTHTPTLL